MKVFQIKIPGYVKNTKKSVFIVKIQIFTVKFCKKYKGFVLFQIPLATVMSVFKPHYFDIFIYFAKFQVLKTDTGGAVSELLSF